MCQSGNNSNKNYISKCSSFSFCNVFSSNQSSKLRNLFLAVLVLLCCCCDTKCTLLEKDWWWFAKRINGQLLTSKALYITILKVRTPRRMFVGLKIGLQKLQAFRKLQIIQPRRYDVSAVDRTVRLCICSSSRKSKFTISDCP